MIKGSIKGTLNFPKLQFQSDLLHIGQKIFIPFMVKFLDDGKHLSGNAYPELEPQTLSSKKGPRTLVETGKLRKSFRAKTVGKDAVRVDLLPQRSEIGKHLQIEGVGKKKKKFLFFGINKEMEKRAIDFMKLKIRRAVKNGGRRTVIR